MIANVLDKIKNTYYFFGNLNQKITKSIKLQSLVIAKNNRLKDKIDSLCDVEFSGFSQWGEDGIIDWSIERLPGIKPIFIEFGVENYQESNTRLLLQLRNWKGFVLDGSSKNVANIQNQSIYWRYHLQAKCAFINRDNINDLIKSVGLLGEIGLLSIDIDGNDYWVWETINIVSPAIVVCEYNALFGDLEKISIPYQPEFQRGKAHYSNLYFGASILALIDLAQQKGYTFVGTNSNGCNAFFVRNDYANFVINSINQVKFFPSLFAEGRNLKKNALTYYRGVARLQAIEHLPVYSFTEKKNKLLSELNLYSENWA